MQHARSNTHTHAGCYAVQWRAFSTGKPTSSVGEYLLVIFYPPTIMMQTSISRVQDSRLCRYSLPVPSTSTMSSRRPWLARQRAQAELAHPDALSLIAKLALVWASTAPRVFSVNSAPRVASGTTRLCTSFTDMPFPVKVKVPFLKGLFNSSKKRTKAQDPGAQNKVPDR